jgi:hypothetical protein
MVLLKLCRRSSSLPGEDSFAEKVHCFKTIKDQTTEEYMRFACGFKWLVISAGINA